MHAALLKEVVFFNNNLHSHNAKARKPRRTRIGTPSNLGHCERQDLTVFLLEAVLPPYRGGILLRAEINLQVIILHFFYNVKTRKEFGLASKITGVCRWLTDFARVETLGPKGIALVGNFDFEFRKAPFRHALAGGIVAFVVLTLSVHALLAREKDTTQYGAGLIVNMPFPEKEVTQVVQEVVQNGVIRGTKEYSKDEYLGGAESAITTSVFPQWAEGGKVFYKVRLKALDPWNFKNTTDSGTVAVRYVVQAQDANHTVVRIDAKFVEDYRHVSHSSNGSVEGAEYKDIHDRLDAIAVMKAEAAEAEKAKDSSSKAQQILRDQPSVPEERSTPPVIPASEPMVSQTVVQADPSPTQAFSTDPVPPMSLEERVQQLRKQVERRVKSPGAPLKSAPFHTASTVQSLPPGTEVLIEIATPYWLGVETHDGQHGWMLKDELELMP